MSGLRIAVMPGDGVGPEVTAAAVRVLEAAVLRAGRTVDMTRYPHAVGYVEPAGVRISEATIDEIAAHDALLFGAQGGASDGSDGVATRPLIAIANRLDLSVGVRSVRLYAGHLSPLRHVREPFDILMVRDVSEDCYVGPGGGAHVGTPQEVAVGLLLYTAAAVDRVLRHALSAASTRRQRVDLVTQVEGVAADRLWHARLEALAPEYPGVDVRTCLPDTAASRLVEDPASFDVIATTYWIGGILSNLMASVAGGVGLLPSARINPDRGFGLFEPAHGTAPMHVGRGTVSPIAAIRATAMLLDAVGMAAASQAVEDAVARAITSGRVPDVSTRSGLRTDDVASVVLDELASTS